MTLACLEHPRAVPHVHGSWSPNMTTCSPSVRPPASDSTLAAARPKTLDIEGQPQVKGGTGWEAALKKEVERREKDDAIMQ